MNNSSSGLVQILTKPMDRRTAVQSVATSLALGLGWLETSCSPFASDASREEASLNWNEYFQGNFKLMTDDEKQQTVERLERLHQIKTGQSINVATSDARKDVLYGYAFNISKLEGATHGSGAALA